MSESYIICEGFHDRAFWTGWLLSLGFTDPGVASTGGRKDVFDPWQVRVARGQFGLISPSVIFTRIVPVNGEANIARTARIRLKEHGSKTLANLILCADAPDAMSPDSIHKMLREFDTDACRHNDHHCSLYNNSVQVYTVNWQAPDPPHDHLPEQQTLERLVCASIVAAYPERGLPVKAWLDSRPSAPAAEVKSFAWSHMAGWYSDRGCESFYRAVWEDSKIAEELEKRLRATGSYDIVANLQSPIAET